MKLTEEGIKEIVNDNLKLYRLYRPRDLADNYTVLATINDCNNGQLIALATGTQASSAIHSDDIEDCHAESLVKRAFKRHLLDTLKQCKTEDEFHRTVNDLNGRKLLLFITQFPCGLLQRYQGEEPRDEETGALLERKPGRGQDKNGRIVYVHRSSCLNKLKRWISTSGLQGKRMQEYFGLKCQLSHLAIGKCEPNIDTDYQYYSDLLKQSMDLDNNKIEYSLIPMRDEQFVFDANSKRPLPISIACWQTQHQACSVATKTFNGFHYMKENLVDGRRMGLTRKQIEQGEKTKLKVGDYWLRKDALELVDKFK